MDLVGQKWLLLTTLQSASSQARRTASLVYVNIRSLVWSAQVWMWSVILQERVFLMENTCRLILYLGRIVTAPVHSAQVNRLPDSSRIEHVLVQSWILAGTMQGPQPIIRDSISHCWSKPDLSKRFWSDQWSAAPLQRVANHGELHWKVDSIQTSLKLLFTLQR